MTHRVILPLLVLLTATTSSAKELTQLPLFDGALVLRGEVAVLEDKRTPTSAEIKVWRPILFGTPEKPIGGRMDCNVGALRQVYSDPLFDIRQRYKDSREQREAAGLRDFRNPVFAEEGPVRRLEITGRASNPVRHYVLTYVAIRDGEGMYDIRINCNFRAHHAPDSSTDFPALQRRYLDLGVPIALPAQQSQTEGQ